MNGNEIGGQGVFPEEEPGLEGASSESNIACDFEMVRLDLFSQIPRRRNGIAVAATRSLARPGMLPPGSQRKSRADKKKVSIAQTASEPTAIKNSRFQGAGDQ